MTQLTIDKNRALLLDRDGVINVDHGYIGSVDRFAFMPGLFPFLRAARDRGYRLAVLTNQSGVARGMYSAQDHDRVTQHMLAGLQREQIAIDLCLACFDHPEGLPPHAFESFWRKPNPGMVLESVRRLHLNPVRSALIGDSLRDMEAGLAGGIGKCLWLTDKNPAVPTGVAITTNFDIALSFL